MKKYLQNFTRFYNQKRLPAYYVCKNAKKCVILHKAGQIYLYAPDFSGALFYLRTQKKRARKIKVNVHV